MKRFLKAGGFKNEGLAVIKNNIRNKGELKMETKLNQVITKFGETRAKDNFCKTLSELDDAQKEEFISTVHCMLFDENSLISCEEDIVEFFNTTNKIMYKILNFDISNQNEFLAQYKQQFIDIDSCIFWIKGGSDLTLHDITNITGSIDDNLSDDAYIIIGTEIDKNITDNSVVLSIFTRL